MMKGTIYITNDINYANSAIINSRIVAIGEIDEMTLRALNGVRGSIILPPYTAIEAELDNDVNRFVQIYTQYLDSYEVQSFIAVIIKAIHSGINILLYLSPDESEMGYSRAFMEYMKRYGMVIGTVNSPFMYDVSFDGINLSLMYMNDLISEEELLVLYPIQLLIPDIVCNKLAINLHPYGVTNLQEASLYFNNYKEKIKANGNRFLSQAIEKK